MPRLRSSALSRRLLVLSAFGLSGLVSGCSGDFLLAEMDKLEAVDDTGSPADDVVEDGEEDEDEPVGDDPADDDGTAVGEDDPVDEETPDPDDEPVPDDPAPEDDCDETSDLIYVLDKDSGSISLFDPRTLALTTLGVPDCDSWSTPSSMGVARDGFAYVRYADQEVFVVDVNTLDCAATGYDTSRTGFGSFGMGFATTSAETWRDELFVANSTVVGRLDTTSWQITTLGALPSQAELTGTGAGELWAVLPLESPARIVELNQSTGGVERDIRTDMRLDISNLDTFAFAAWGGEFYLFARYHGMGNSTEVHRLDRSGNSTLVVAELGINVVGAGVSTCAPTED